MSSTIKQAEEMAMAGGTQVDSQIIACQVYDRLEWIMENFQSSSPATAQTPPNLEESQYLETPLLYPSDSPPPSPPLHAPTVLALRDNPTLAHLNIGGKTSLGECAVGNKMSIPSSSSSGSTTQELSQSWYDQRERALQDQCSTEGNGHIDLMKALEKNEEDFSQNEPLDEEEMETQIAPETPSFQQSLRQSFPSVLPPSQLFDNTQISPAIPTSTSQRPSPYSPDNLVSPQKPAISSPIKRNNNTMAIDSPPGSQSSDGSDFPRFARDRSRSDAEDYIAQTEGFDARDTQQDDEVVVDSQIENVANSMPLVEISPNLMTPQLNKESSSLPTQEVVPETSPLQGRVRTFAEVDESNPDSDHTQIDFTGIGFSQDPEFQQIIYGSSLPAAKSQGDNIAEVPRSDPEAAHVEFAGIDVHRGTNATPQVLQSSSIHGAVESSRIADALTDPMVLDTPQRSNYIQDDLDDSTATGEERPAKRLKLSITANETEAAHVPNFELPSIEIGFSDEHDGLQSVLASADTGLKYSTAPEAPARLHSVQSSALSELSDTSPRTPDAFQDVGQEPDIMEDILEAETEDELQANVNLLKEVIQEPNIIQGAEIEGEPRADADQEVGQELNMVLETECEPEANTDLFKEVSREASAIPEAESKGESKVDAAKTNSAKKPLKRKRATDTPSSSAATSAKKLGRPAKKANPPSMVAQTTKKATPKAIKALKGTPATTTRSNRKAATSGLGSVQKPSPKPRMASESTSGTRSSSRLSTAPPDLGINVPSTPRERGNLDNPAGLFSNMSFAVSYDVDNQQQKEVILNNIYNEGGRVLNNGFDELFSVDTLPVTPSRSKRAAQNDTNNVLKDLEKLKLSAVAKQITFCCLISDFHSRKSKYMQALSLDLPCLHGKWIVDCVARQQIIDWSPYLLSSGESSLLGGAVRSRILTPYSAESAKLSDHFDSESRMRLLQGKNVLVVAGTTKLMVDKRKAYVFIIQALGAESVGTVPDADAARTILKTSAGRQKWDWVYVDKNENAGQAALDEVPHRNSTKAKKSKNQKTAKVDEATPATPMNLRAKVVGDQFIIQSLILGRLLNDDSPNPQEATEEYSDDELL